MPIGLEHTKTRPVRAVTQLIQLRYPQTLSTMLSDTQALRSLITLETPA